MYFRPKFGKTLTTFHSYKQTFSMKKKTSSLTRTQSLPEKCTRENIHNTVQGHLPKHLITEEVSAEERNFIPADPPGK